MSVLLTMLRITVVLATALAILPLLRRQSAAMRAWLCTRGTLVREPQRRGSNHLTCKAVPLRRSPWHGSWLEISRVICGY